MNTQPITLTPDQIRAALAGRLTQIRMSVEPQPEEIFAYCGLEGADFIPGKVIPDDDWPCGVVVEDGEMVPCPWGVVGDRLTCDGDCPAIGPHHGDTCDCGRIQSPNAQFTQDCQACKGSGVVGITLELIAVRVERLGDISECDCEKTMGFKVGELGDDAYPRFRNWWYAKHGQRHPWILNLWVWVLDVRRVEGGEV